MPPPDHDRLSVGEQRTAIETEKGVERARYAQVDRSQLFGFHRQGTLPRQHLESDVRGIAMDPLDEVWHDEVGEVIVHDHQEVAHARRRIERIGDQQASHACERVGERLLERERPRRRLHPGADAHEQRVAEQISEAFQRMAHRRLRAPHSAGGTSDVGFGNQRFQGDEEVQIDGNKIRHVNVHDSINRLDEWRSQRQIIVMKILVPLLVALSASTPMTHLQSRHLFTMTIKLHPTEELGQTPAGNRRVFAVSGGDFKGDRLQGIILPIMGWDLLLTRPDGSSQQDVRMLLRTDDGATILITYRGVRHASTEVNERLARGETVPPSEYYLRTAPFFETSSPKYAWLNKVVTIGVGERRPDAVIYEVFEILLLPRRPSPFVAS